MNRRDFIRASSVLIGSMALGGLENILIGQDNPAKNLDNINPRIPEQRLEDFKNKLIEDPELKAAGVTREEILGYFSDKRYRLHRNMNDYFKSNPEKKADNASAGIIDPAKKKEADEKAYQTYKKVLEIDDKKDYAIKFYKENEEHLIQAEKIYGVDRRYIVATLGIESDFGKEKGHWLAFNALTSIYAHVTAPRKVSYNEKQPDGSIVKKIKNEDWGDSFALPQAVKLILLAHRQKELLDKNTNDIIYSPSSYAACVDYGQFTPDSMWVYAVGRNGDFKAKLFDIVDSIYSVANYYKKRLKWKPEFNNINHLEAGNDGMRKQILALLRGYNNSPNFGRALIELANDAKWPAW
jgi:hypothetical protein